MDYMLIKQLAAPDNHSLENIVFLLEETKTSDAESRNTGIGQRATKFAYANHYCPDIPKYMLYNEETTPDTNRAPTQTNILEQICYLHKISNSSGRQWTYLRHLLLSRN